MGSQKVVVHNREHSTTHMRNAKLASGLGAGITVVALAVALIQHQGKREAEATLATVEKQMNALRADFANVNARLAQAERRATEAERDSGDLLKAVEATREQQAARAARTAASSGTSLPGPPSVVRTPEEEERLAHERTYQQMPAK